MSTLEYCTCGCAYNSDSFDECPKCGAGNDREDFRRCISCGIPLTRGECADVCEPCWRAEAQP